MSFGLIKINGMTPEYFNQNSESKIIPMGTFHYIQWEYPHEIADILISLSK